MFFSRLAKLKGIGTQRPEGATVDAGAAPLAVKSKGRRASKVPPPKGVEGEGGGGGGKSQDGAEERWIDYRGEQRWQIS